MMKEQTDLGSEMVIDTTGLKIRGINYVYLHIADVKSGIPIVYAICEKEDVATIEPILRRLRSLGYSPRIVICDLAPELLVSIKDVFPDANIQGCLFHLSMWLNKELPTKKTVKKMGKEKITLWREVKSLITYAATSKDKDTRSQYLEQLKKSKLRREGQKRCGEVLGQPPILPYYGRAERPQRHYWPV